MPTRVRARFFAAFLVCAPRLNACTQLLGDFKAGDHGGGGADASTSSTADTVSTGSSGGMGGASPSTSSGSGDPCASCSPNATCSGMVCQCNLGFGGDGKTCGDIDECSQPQSACGANSTCVNTVGAFECTCDTGFALSGSECVPIWTLRYVLGKNFTKGKRPYAALGAKRLFIANNDAKLPFFYSIGPLDPAFVLEGGMPTTSNDFCGCGLEATMTVVGDTPYVFGTYGQYYSVLSGWKPITAYADNFKRGSAGAIYLDTINEVYFLGGHDTLLNELKSILRFSTKTSNFYTTNLPTFEDYPYGPIRNANLASNSNGQVYVVGGNVNNVPSNTAARFSPSMGTWEKLPAATIPTPIQDIVRSPQGVLVSNPKELAQFSEKLNAWLPKTFSFPPNGSEWRLVGNPTTTYAVGNVGSSIQVYELAVIPN